MASKAYSASATFTPAANSHVAPDVHGAAAEFAFRNQNNGPPPAGGHLKITGASLRIDGATIETTAWRVHLYNVTPPSAIADDAAFDIPSGDRASYLGFVDIPQIVDVGSTLYVDAAAFSKQVKLAGTSLFGYLVNGTTLTPQAVAHVVTLQAELV